MAESKADGATRHVRYPEDLAEKLGWIVDLKGGSAARILDELTRDAIEARYAPLRRRVENIKAAKAANDDDPPFANELAPDLGEES